MRLNNHIRWRNLLSLAGTLLLSACTADIPTRPTQFFDAPKISCPASVSLLSPVGLALTVQYGNATASAGTPPTTVSCTPVSGSSFPVGVTTVTCTVTDQVKRTDTCSLTVSITAPPRLAVTRFLAYGDSMTWGEDGTEAVARIGGSSIGIVSAKSIGTVSTKAQYPAAMTYPGVLQAELAARYLGQSPTVFNDGLIGEHVTDQSAFQNRFVPAVTSGQYDAVLLMEGANDIVLYDVSTTAAAMKTYVQTAQGAGLKVFLATLPPEDPNGVNGPNSVRVPVYNSLLRVVATQTGVPLVDVEAAFGGNLSLLGPDGLHPNAAGYQIIANTFFASIKQNLEVFAGASSLSTHPLPLVAPSQRR